MFTWLSILMIVLGIALLFFGRRLWLLGTGIGALLGVSLVLLMPGLFGGWLGVIAIVGLAILVGILTFIFKAFGKVIAWGLGFLAGGAITMSLLGLLSINAGLWSFLLGVLGGLVGIVLSNRFFDWVILISAGLIGAMLAVRGVELFMGGTGLNDALSSILVAALAVFSIWYQARIRRQEAK